MITVTTDIRENVTYVLSIHSSNVIMIGNEVPNSEVQNEIKNQETIINNYINQ